MSVEPIREKIRNKVQECGSRQRWIFCSSQSCCKLEGPASERSTTNWVRKIPSRRELGPQRDEVSENRLVYTRIIWNLCDRERRQQMRAWWKFMSTAESTVTPV